jgi:arylsulfatase A-like enzyme
MGIAIGASQLNPNGCKRGGGRANIGKSSRIVMVVVLDQVGSWVLERYLPKLRPEGLLVRTMRRGMYHHRVTYNYAGTYTAPGHAAIYTGQPPARSGVAMNRAWNRDGHNTISIVDDHQHPVFDGHNSFASPGLLQVDTVADALIEQTHGRAKVLSVSMKDRGAVIPGGRTPTMAIWYDEHSGTFTTSTHYAAQLPPWLSRWNRDNPVRNLFRPWTRLSGSAPIESPAVDNVPGEGDWKGLGRIFPHDLARATDPQAAVLATPMSTDWLLAMTSRAVDEYDLGRDDVTDLLAISVSGTDYVGHVFGPESLEAEDNLLRVDLALGRLVTQLESEGRGPVSVLITADHGVARLPEANIAAGLDAHRLDWDGVPAQINRILAAEMSAGSSTTADAGPDSTSPVIANVVSEAGTLATRAQADSSVHEQDASRASDGADGAVDSHPSPQWVEAYVQPFVFLTPAARSGPDRSAIVQRVIRALHQIPGVYGAFDVQNAEQLRASRDRVERAVGWSIPSRASYPLGDVFVVPSEGSLVDERMPQGSGTSHGSPWTYDIEVPVLMSGPAVQRGQRPDALEQTRVAATICALLRIDPPHGAPTTALPGVQR